MPFRIEAREASGSKPACVVISGLTGEQKSHLLVILSTRAPRQTTPAGPTTGFSHEGNDGVRVNFERFTSADIMIGLVTAFLLQEGLGSLGGRN